MTLLRSGENLLKNIKSFIHVSDEVTVFSPFIRVNKLKEILGDVNCNNVVVRWQEVDILFGVTDFEKLYEYCKENNISLYRNQDIHLKVIQNEKNEIIFGSSNITNKGMGNSNFNIELSGENKNLELEDLIYLKRIINNSVLVDEVYFEELKDRIDLKRENYKELLKIDKIKIEHKQKKDQFLLSALPMSQSPTVLYNIYNSGSDKKFENEDINCAINDLANYSIGSSLEEDEFYSDLRLAFNTHPFIVKLKKKIRNLGSMNYGTVVDWIGKNTTTVPTPRNWELKEKQIINILYDWICFFDRRYEWSRPNYSQVIFFNAEDESGLKAILDKLKRDSNKGILAPHQILLLITIQREFNSYNNIELSIKDIQCTYEIVWNEYRKSISSDNLNLGVPIRALKNQGLIEVNFYNESDPLKEKYYRIKNKLLEKVKSIILSENLINGIKNENEAEEIIASYF